MIKKIIKNLIGWCQCKRFGIASESNTYIGARCKIVNMGGVKFLDKVTIRPDTHIYVDATSQLCIGNNTEIGRGSTITASNLIIIGDGVLTGPRVFISDHNHQYENPNEHIFEQGIRMNKGDSVMIGNGTWIGTNAVIVGNIKIGRNCVIGANSVVTKDIPDYSVAVGIPAKVIKRYDFESNTWIKV